MSLIRTLWRCTFSPRLFKIYEVTWIGLVDVSTTHLFSVFRRNLHKVEVTMRAYALQKSYEAKNLERWGDQIVISVSVPREQNGICDSCRKLTVSLIVLRSVPVEIIQMPANAIFRYILLI